MKSLFFFISLFLSSVSSAQSRTAKALVVGISQYQDTSLHAFSAARRDAEEYAAFLQSPSGGSIERDQILLLTDEEATLAGFMAGLEWLMSEKPIPSKRLLYFAGSALYMTPGQKKEDVLMFFNDSPATPFQGNTCSLKGIKKRLEKQGETILNAPVFLAVSFKSPFEKSDSLGFEWKGTGKTKRSSWLKWSQTMPDAGLSSSAFSSKGQKSISSDLVTGLLGLADYDGNRMVSGPEIFRHISTQSSFYYPPGACLYLSVTDKEKNLSKVDERILNELEQRGNNELFPPIVQLESMPAEERLLQKSAPVTRRLYEDFILAIKVKNFLPPRERNAAALYDSLLLVPELLPIAGYLRRRLAAAMLDDTQQALNAYLNTSANELARRQKYTEPYKRYAQQLQKANELLGKQHMMSNTLEAKRLYFEGLELRLRSLAEKDSSWLSEAMEKQRAALHLEPEAAYIHNELGVVCINKNDTAEAKKQFLEAIEYSPTWSIPYNNLSILALNAGDWQAANYYGIEAIRHAPYNPGGYANLGVVYAEKKDWAQAETLFRRAVRLGAERPVVYYNLACLEAKKAEKGMAIDWLLQAHEKGWDDFDILNNDEDLVSLHALSEWKAMVRKYYPDKVKE